MSDVETPDYIEFARRIIKAAGKRTANDIESLRLLDALHAEVDQALTTAVVGLREQGFSWAEIAARTGTTKQAAHARWASKQL